jgi:hypothetical protein
MYYGFVVMEKHIKRIFSSRRKKRLSGENLKPSAVLVPLFYDGKEYRVLLTRSTRKDKFHSQEADLLRKIPACWKQPCVRVGRKQA